MLEETVQELASIYKQNLREVLNLINNYSLFTGIEEEYFAGLTLNCDCTGNMQNLNKYFIEQMQTDTDVEKRAKGYLVEEGWRNLAGLKIFSNRHKGSVYIYAVPEELVKEFDVKSGEDARRLFQYYEVTETNMDEKLRVCLGLKVSRRPRKPLGDIYAFRHVPLCCNQDNLFYAGYRDLPGDLLDSIEGHNLD